MNSSLIPYHDRILVPCDWEAAGLVFSVPGTIDGYSGAAALVLAHNALHVCGPEGRIRTVLYDHIREVSICDMSGIVVERTTSVGPQLARPRDAFGIDITGEAAGGIRFHLRVLVYFYNQAAQWVAEIEDVVDAFYQQALTNQIIVRRQRQK